MEVDSVDVESDRAAKSSYVYSIFDNGAMTVRFASSLSSTTSITSTNGICWLAEASPTPGGTTNAPRTTVEAVFWRHSDAEAGIRLPPKGIDILDERPHPPAEETSYRPYRSESS
jgi:hypothetical protein